MSHKEEAEIHEIIGIVHCSKHGFSITYECEECKYKAIQYKGRFVCENNQNPHVRHIGKVDLGTILEVKHG